jgi:hypothetical protein
MIDTKNLPSPTDGPEYHADFLELTALKSASRSVSIHEYIRDLKIANADETLADAEGDKKPEEDLDQSEPLAEAAFGELDDRNRSCGKDANRYPFEITSNSLKLREDADKSIYTFLALLSWFGKDAGPAASNGEKLFEEVCARAAAAYLGGPIPQVKWYVFGFPRRVEPKGFKAALNALCNELGEGQGHHKGRLKTPHEKDGKLDVVAWREFHDRRQGKLIAFGQCATGENWSEKVTELPQSVDWCTTWMADRPGVWPVRSFFVPHRIDRTNWFDTCVKGGILHDRCRIASLAPGVDKALEEELANWSSHVLNDIRRTQG